MNLRYLYVLICLIVFLTACSAPKEVLYLQDIATIKQEKIEKGYPPTVPVRAVETSRPLELCV